jgi:hypothetical protein
MRSLGRGVVVGALLAVMLAAGAASAENNPNGVAFRAVGFFRGRGEIQEGQITCEIPTVEGAIADGAFSMGLWNTFGVPNLNFPDVNGAFSNPCGGWVQLQNNLVDQAIALDRVELRYKIPGARRFRQFVPTRRGFPIACRQMRHETLFVGGIINPINSGQFQSGSGAVNVTFIQLLPLVSTQIFNCLRSQYAPLSTDLYSSLTVRIRATVFGVSDVGDGYRSNTLNYTLTLRHTCGNGRVDDGEFCDPLAPSSCPSGSCLGGICTSALNRACTTDADCTSVCTTGGIPEECVCVFP